MVLDSLRRYALLSMYVTSYGIFVITFADRSNKLTHYNILPRTLYRGTYERRDGVISDDMCGADVCRPFFFCVHETHHPYKKRRFFVFSEARVHPGSLTHFTVKTLLPSVPFASLENRWSLGATA